MSDETEGLFAGEQSAETSAEPSGSRLTLEEVKSLINELKSEIKEDLHRVAQSQKDSNSRLKEVIDERLKTLSERYSALGMPVPEEAKKQAINDVLLYYDDQEEAQGDEEEEEVSGQPDLIKAVNERARKITERYGLEWFVAQDPELALIKTNSSDPFEYLESVEEAARKKAERLNLNKKPAQGAPPRSFPGFGGPAPGSGSTIADINDPHELIKMGLRKLT